MTVTVVSAVFGGYDTPIVPLAQDCDVRWIMVTDEHTTPPPPWEHVIEPRWAGVTPRLQSRHPKCMTVDYGGPVLWLDASAEIVSPSFVSDCLDALGDGDVAMWPHPHRTTLTAEAEAVSALPDTTGPVHQQVAHYLACGHPDGFGLWACGAMMWAGHVSHNIGRAWWVELASWGTDRDQLSWPVIARRFRLDVRPLPGDLYDEQRVRWRTHRGDL